MTMTHISEVMPATLEDIAQRIERGKRELARIDPEGLEVLRRRDAEIERLKRAAGGDS